jgi:hypothetical protein
MLRITGRTMNSASLTLRDAAKTPLSELENEYGPHPEELAAQASRRMAASVRLAAILRDAREDALLRMRKEVDFQPR